MANITPKQQQLFKGKFSKQFVGGVKLWGKFSTADYRFTGFKKQEQNPQGFTDLGYISVSLSDGDIHHGFFLFKFKVVQGLSKDDGSPYIFFSEPQKATNSLDKNGNSKFMSDFSLVADFKKALVEQLLESLDGTEKVEAVGETEAE